MKATHLLRTGILAAMVGLQLLTFTSNTRAAAGDVDLSFDAGASPGGEISSAAVQPDGKIIVAGWFGSARLHPDGRNDGSFQRGSRNYDTGGVNALVLQPDGKALIGHREGVDRLNVDGTLDSTFSASVDPTENSAVYAVAVQPNGKVLIGGNISGINGTARHTIAQLNADGTLDPAFDAAAVSGQVFSIIQQADGKILIGGRLSTAAGEKCVVRLNADGSFDGSFDSAFQSGGVVTSLALQDDGKLVAAGFFSVGGNANLARLNPNGTADLGFQPNTGTNNTVFSVVLQSDGKLLVAGGFSAVNGAPRKAMARINANGSLDESYNPGVNLSNPDGDVHVRGIIPQIDGKMLIAGSFTHIGGIIRDSFARLETNGDLDASFNPGRGVNGSVSSILVQPEGNLLISGSFTGVSGVSHNGIARLSPDGALEPTTFHRVGTFGPVTATAIQSDGKVLIGMRAGMNRVHADGSFDNTFSVAGGAVTAITVQGDGHVLYGGYQTMQTTGEDGSIDTYYRHFLNRVDANGQPDNTFAAALGEWLFGDVERPTTLVVQPDGKVLVGGVFASFKGINRFGLARVNADGTLDTGFVASPNNYVSSVALQPDGKVLVGGVFTVIDGMSRRRIARLHANGAVDSSFDPGTGANDYVDSIALQSDGKVLMAGGFTNFAGAGRNHIVRLNSDGSLDSGFDPGAGADRVISSVALQTDGKVLVGGAFTTVDGVRRPRVARLEGLTSPAPRTFSNTNAIPIHDPTQPRQIGTGTPYPSTINVSGFAASDAIEKITVTVHNLAHELVDDVDILLVAPSGQSLILCSDAGGRQEPPAAVTLTFDDAVADPIADDGPLVSGTYRPSNYEMDDRFPTPAPSPSAATTLASFAGTNPNGEWKLYVVDDEVFDAGGILNGWSINIQTGPARPEISVEQPAGTALVDGTATIDLGALNPGSSGDATFVVKNLGGAELSAVSASVEGVNASTFSVTAQPAATIAPNASSTLVVRFSPVSRGPHSATLRISSNDADESPFEIILTGTGVNGPPVAIPDTTTTAYQTAVEINVLANDSDPEGDLLTVTVASATAHGTTQVIDTVGGQRIHYAPVAGFSGSDSFTYAIDDGFGGSASAAVTVTVSANPRGKKVVSKGATVPGAGEPSSGVPAGATWSRFGIPSIASDGTTAFCATLRTPAGRVPVVYRGSSEPEPQAGAEHVVASRGDLAPGGNGATFGSFKDPLLNDHGTIVFMATLRGGTVAAKSGIWKQYAGEGAGPSHLVAQLGMEPAGVPGARWKAFNSLAVGDAVAGEEIIAFTATMTTGPGGVRTADDLGLWLADANGIKIALREGATMSIGSASQRVKSFVALQPLPGAVGQGRGITGRSVLARVKFDDGSHGIVRVSLTESGTEYAVIALGGDTLAGLGVNLEMVGLPTQSRAGDAGFTATLAQTARGSDAAIFQSTGSDLELVAREGEEAMDGNGATFSAFTSVAGDSAGRIAFRATLRSGTANGASDTAIFLRHGSTSEIIAREGDQPPGVAPGAKWGGFSSLALPDGAGGPMFIGTLVAPAPGQPNPGRITRENNIGLWASDATGALHLVVRTGDSFDSQRRITALAVLANVPGSTSQTRSFSTTGRVIYRVTLTDGSQHVVNVSIP